MKSILHFPVFNTDKINHCLFAIPVTTRYGFKELSECWLFCDEMEKMCRSLSIFAVFIPVSIEFDETGAPINADDQLKTTSVTIGGF